MHPLCNIGFVPSHMSISKNLWKMRHKAVSTLPMEYERHSSQFSKVPIWVVSWFFWAKHFSCKIITNFEISKIHTIYPSIHSLCTIPFHFNVISVEILRSQKRQKYTYSLTNLRITLFDKIEYFSHSCFIPCPRSCVWWTFGFSNAKSQKIFTSNKEIH
jgi:hypothetical protein